MRIITTLCLGCFNLFFLCRLVRFVETHGVELLEQNLYRNFTAHLTALQKLNIVGADTFLRDILNFAPLSTFYLILINLKHHSKVLHVTLKMSLSAISHLQKKIITSSTMSHLESSWQNMRGRRWVSSHITALAHILSS